jgi:Zn-dependent peptidase ImmA (M78 family)
MTNAQLISAAAGAALKAQRQFGVDRQKRVEVFDVLRSVASEVFFRPLNRICGAYLPSQDGPPGVLINSNLPLSRQRYTAAHEFGHLFLHHTAASVDEFSEDSSLEMRTSGNIEESIAEAFAAFFLMPTPLVKISFDELRISELSAQAIYLASLKMGTSYMATVNHLYTLKRLSYAQATALRSQQPKAIKRELSDDRSIGRHDVWIVDEHWNGKPIFPTVEDTVVLHLPETPTSGYSWVWDRNPEGLRIVEDGFADQAGEEVGGKRVREFIAEVSDSPTPQRISLARRPPWDPGSTPSSEFTLDMFPQQIKKTGPLILPSLRAAS